MKEGVMYTTVPNGASSEAKGIALPNAKIGEDLGLKDLHGKVKIKQGKISSLNYQAYAKEVQEPWT